MAEQYYTYTNESFSGCDMVATILLPKVNGSGCDVYTIGELQTISYSIHMDRQPVRAIGNINVKDYVMGPRTIAGSLVFAVFNKHFANKMMKEISNSVQTGYAFLIDEIPPFDIVISMANEYGLRSRMVIYGVRLVNEGQVMSVNDVYTENTYQFVATDLEYLTDENQYTSGHKSGKGLYKIVEEGVTTYNNNIQYKYKKATPTSHFNVELNYKVTKIATQLKQGIVDFWLTPTMKNGTIKITSDKQQKSIDVATSINGANRIVVQLPAGEYSAVWSNSERKSNTINFRVAQNIVTENTVFPAPLIESVEDTSISVYANTKEHTKLIYENEDKQTFSIKLSGRRAKINNLNAASKYKIATCDDNMNTISDYVTVTTLQYGHDHYQNFLEYLNYNKKSLKNEDFDFYYTAVMDGKQLALSGIQYATIADSFIDVNKKYAEKLGNLAQEDFPGLIEYQEEVDRLNSLIDVAVEITYIATIINNDSIYGYNYDVMVVDPPVSESTNSCTSSFWVDYTIESLDFFRQYVYTQQFNKTIGKANFKDVEDGYSCIFNGRPGARYYTYAVNKYGFRSPKVDFYVLSDSDKSEALENEEYNNSLIRYELSKANDLYSHKLESTLTDDERTRVLTEILKESEVKLISTPRIVAQSDKIIKVELNENEELLKENEVMATISNIDDALLNNVTRYKVPASTEVEFSVYNHGIRPNNTYIIWIEDKDGNQISDPITAYTDAIDEVTELREYDINKYFIEEIIEKFKEEFKNQKISSNTLDLILYKHQNETSNTKANIMERILEDIMLESSTLSNIYDILHCFFKVYMEHTYSINEDFFEDSPVLNKENGELTINEECIAQRIDINADGFSTSVININSGDLINIKKSTAVYSMISFVSKSIDKRSGFILSNNISDLYVTHKMKVKVGEQSDD